MNTAASLLHPDPVRTARYYPEFPLAASIPLPGMEKHKLIISSLMAKDGEKRVREADREASRDELVSC